MLVGACAYAENFYNRKTARNAVELKNIFKTKIYKPLQVSHPSEHLRHENTFEMLLFFLIST